MPTFGKKSGHEKMANNILFGGKNAQNGVKTGIFRQNNILFGGKNASVAKNPLFFFMIIINNIINKKVLSKKSGFLAMSSFFG
jgi:hypothetical protein